MGIKKDLRVRLKEQENIISPLLMVVDFDNALRLKQGNPSGFNFINKRFTEWAILKTCILFDEDSFSGFKKTINSLTKGGESPLNQKYKDMKNNFDALNLKDLRDNHIAHLDSARLERVFNHEGFYLFVKKIEAFHLELRESFAKKNDLNQDAVFVSNSNYLIELLP